MNRSCIVASFAVQTLAGQERLTIDGFDGRRPPLQRSGSDATRFRAKLRRGKLFLEKRQERFVTSVFHFLRLECGR